MPETATLACFHCTLPAGPRPLRYRVAGGLEPFCCQGCYLVHLVTGQHGERGESLLALARLGVGVTGGMVVMIFSWSHYADRYLLGGAAGEPDALAVFSQYYVMLAATLVVAVLGLPILRDAVRGVASLRAGVAPLIALGAFSAYVASVVSLVRGGETYFDTATMILVFFTFGRFLEARGRASAAEAIRALRGLVPETARVLRPGGEALVPAGDVGLGERVLVRPGEMVPVDGVVREGRGSVNEASLTGESRPVTREPGDRLLAGTLSVDGAFVVAVTALAPDRAIARLARLAEEAKQQKPAWVGLADRVASAFTPLVIVLAAGALAFWGVRLGFVPGLLIALSVLLIACPCTLGVATPLAFWTGLAVAARRGILVRSGAVLERLAQVTDVVFDKTGTLTQGTFRLADVLVPPGAEAGGGAGDGRPALQVAASLESRASHPVAAALRAGAAAAGLAELPVAGWRVEPGLGVRGRIADDATEYVLGSRRLMADARLPMAHGLDRAAARRGELGETLVYLGWAGQVRAAFAAGEEARPEAGSAVSALRRLGTRVAMLTGDERGSAERLGASLGIDDIRWGLLPHEKVAAVQAAPGGPASRRLAMVGDGINDAAALAAAHVGIALGCGADVARDAADITMVGGDLRQVPWLLRFARRVRRTVATNLVWSFAYNTVGIGLALSGWLPPVLAAMAMVASSLFVIGNTRRLSRAGGGA
jgi:Cu+-exporting ATPase